MNQQQAFAPASTLGRTNIFMAHDKAMEDLDIDDARAALEDALTAVARARDQAGVPTGPFPFVISGRDDYNARSGGCGGWGPWAQSVAQGTTADGDPLFSGAARVGSLVLGRATADILAGFLRAGKPVVWFDPATRQAVEVVAVETVNPEEWKTGWRLRLATEAP